MALTIWRRWLRGGPAARCPPTARTCPQNQNRPSTSTRAGTGLPAPGGGTEPLALCVGLPVLDPDVILLWGTELYMQVARLALRWPCSPACLHTAVGWGRALLGAFSSHLLPHNSAGTGWEQVFTVVLPAPPNASSMIPATSLWVQCCRICHRRAQEGCPARLCSEYPAAPQHCPSKACCWLIVAGLLGAVGHLYQPSPTEDCWYDCNPCRIGLVIPDGAAQLLLGWQSSRVLQGQP